MAKEKVTKEQLEEVLEGIKDNTEPRVIKIANQIREYLTTMKPGEIAYLDFS